MRRVRGFCDLALDPPRALDPTTLESAARGSSAGTAGPRNRTRVMTGKATFRPHERLKDPKDFQRVFERSCFNIHVFRAQSRLPLVVKIVALVVFF